MGLRDFPFKPSYCSDEGNLVTDFYIPALKQSISYDRLAGFFWLELLVIVGLLRFFPMIVPRATLCGAVSYSERWGTMADGYKLCAMRFLTIEQY